MLNSTIDEKLANLLVEDPLLYHLEQRTLHSQDIYTRATVSHIVIRQPTIDLLTTAVGYAMEEADHWHWQGAFGHALTARN